MDFHLLGEFFRWSVLMIIFLFALAVKPNEAAGLCESSVIVHGYQCQEFFVKTEDGYVLNMQRIVADGTGKVNKQPVLLQHGVLVDGMTWVLNSPQQSLAFILADSGYEVWIAHTRGTRLSRLHTTLDASKSEYWNWSWDELVDYDLSATFNFVYNQTGQKLHYVGHSLGTLTAMASFSEGKLVDKLRSAALLSPIAYLNHVTTAITKFAAKAFLGEIINSVGWEEFNPKGKPVALFLNTLCNNPKVDCYDLLAALTGKNCCLNASTIDILLKYEPQSTSTKNLVHLSQNVRDGVITKFNYKFKLMNMVHYGQWTPPIYNLSNIPSNLPLFLSYGGKDALADVTDIKNLLDKLKFHQRDKLTTQFIKDYAHLDFIMAVDAKEKVYNALIAFLRRY